MNSITNYVNHMSVHDVMALKSVHDVVALITYAIYDRIMRNSVLLCRINKGAKALFLYQR